MLIGLYQPDSVVSSKNWISTVVSNTILIWSIFLVGASLWESLAEVDVVV